jgi:hypothetical protein
MQLGKTRIAAAIAILLLLAAFRVALENGRHATAVLEGGHDTLYTTLLWWQYAREHDGAFPALSSTDGLTFDRTGVHSAYRLDREYNASLDDREAALVLGDLNKKAGYVMADVVDESQHFYLGYAITNEAEGRAFVDAYRKRKARGLDFSEDLPAPAGKGTLGGDKLLRLNRDLPERLASQADAEGLPELTNQDFPVMIERPGHYPVSGGWVVYLDRQMKFLPYPGPFPMTEEFVGALEALAAESDTTQRSQVSE